MRLRREDGVYAMPHGKQRPDRRQFRVTVSPEWPAPRGAPRYRAQWFLGGEGVRPKLMICPIPPTAAPTGLVRAKIVLAVLEALEPK